MMHVNRTNQEVALLLLAGVTVVSVLPFAFYRLYHQEWSTAIFNFCLVGVSLFIFLHAWKTHKTQQAAFFIAIVFTIAVNWMVYERGLAQLYWAFPAYLSLYFILSPYAAVLFNGFSLIVLFVITSTLSDAIELATFFIAAIACNAFTFILCVKQQQYQQQLIMLGEKDPLTLVGNRRALNNKLDELIYLNQRSKMACSLFILDIDKFKQVNDKWGHNVGDIILKKLCKIIGYQVRFSDKLFRFGGEEFIVTVDGSTLENAAVLAEKIRASIAEEQFIHGIKFTISIGVAQLQMGETKEEWIDRADKALYQAKNTGRNQVCCAEGASVSKSSSGNEPNNH